MRELKFRAWDKTKKQMIPWEKLCDEDKNYSGDDDTERMADYFNNVFSNIEPLMQFIGILDVNGVEIYEGDILECESCEGYKIRGEVKSVSVFFECPTMRNRKIGEDVLRYTTKEVVGNIYSNPELLEAK